MTSVADISRGVDPDEVPAATGSNAAEGTEPDHGISREGVQPATIKERDELYAKDGMKQILKGIEVFDSMMKGDWNYAHRERYGHWVYQSARNTPQYKCESFKEMIIKLSKL